RWYRYAFAGGHRQAGWSASCRTKTDNAIRPIRTANSSTSYRGAGVSLMVMAGSKLYAVPTFVSGRRPACRRRPSWLRRLWSVRVESEIVERAIPDADADSGTSWRVEARIDPPSRGLGIAAWPRCRVGGAPGRSEVGSRPPRRPGPPNCVPGE